MKIAIVEDEIPARHQLTALLSKLVPEMEIVFESATIRETVLHLGKGLKPDLIFMDIQLNDGLSLEIFNQIELTVPVVFTTAYDQYTMEAFQRNGISYLLKPIKQQDLVEALEKYRILQSHFSENIHSLIRQWKEEEKVYKRRFTVKKGIAFHSLPVSEVAYFYSEHKVTFLVSIKGEKFIIDKPLAQIEEELDPEEFFRVNRKYLTSILAIEKYQGHHNGKLLVILQPEVDEEVIVSQEKASSFKKWLDQD